MLKAKALRVKQVLLCDDQKNLRKVLRNGILQLRDDIEIHEAEDGLGCLDFLSKNPCDLVFLDVEMPNLDGFSTLEKIRGQESERTKVVMVTALSSEEDIGKGAFLDADGYITKPYNLDEVEQALQEHLGAPVA